MIIDKDIIWNKNTYQELINYLISVGEEDYKRFNLRIINTKYEMIGIRMPFLRNVAKKISKTNFMDIFPLFKSRYYEEVLLEGILLGYIKDINILKDKLLTYIPKIDNWGICDTVGNSLKFIGKNKSEFLPLIEDMINDSYEYSKRLGYVLLLNYYLEENYLDEIEKLIYVNSMTKDYYVMMSISWLLSMMYVVNKEKVINIIKSGKLNREIINKTISKVNDSYQISKLDKEELRKLKVLY